MSWRPVTLIAVLWIGCSTPVQAQCRVVEFQELSAAVPGAQDKFGGAVGLSGTVAVVGADRDFSGSAAVFRLSAGTWSHEAKLTGDGGNSDHFGQSVDTEGDIIVVGSPFDDDAAGDSGAVYVFRHDGSIWVREQKLTASDASLQDSFGRRVAISGNIIVVGAPLTDQPGNSSGSAYVFRYDGSSWIEEQKLVASDGAADDLFGDAVALSSQWIVVGSPRDDDGGSGTGSAYVFQHNGSTWVETQKLVASEPGVSAHFGLWVSVDADVLVSGTPGGESGGVYSGSATVFRHDGTSWVEEQELVPSDGQDSDCFGCAVSVSGSQIVCGAPSNDEGGLGAGAGYSYRFDGTTWREVAKLIASNGPAFGLGAAVALDGSNALLGAPNKPTVLGSNVGAVYAYEATPIALDIEPNSVLVNDIVTFRTCGGRAASFTTLILTEVNGTPTSLLLIGILGFFDLSGQRLLTGPVPAAAQGLDLTFQAIALDPLEGLITSNEDSLSVQ